MKKYKEHKDSYNSFANTVCNKKLTEILESKDCDEAESYVKKNYYKYMPLKRNRSIMNVLTYYIEDIVFDNIWKKEKKDFNYKCLMHNEDCIINTAIEKKIKSILSDFLREYKNTTMIEKDLEDIYKEDYIYENTYKYMYDILENKLLSLCCPMEQLCDCVIYVTYKYFNSFSKDFLWCIFGEQIIKNLRYKSDKFCYVCECEDGVEYLGVKYKIKEVLMDGEIIQDYTEK